MRLSPRVALVLLAVTAAPAWGQTDVSFRDLMNARNYAMGGAFRGLALGTEMIEGNPAGVAARKRYFIELSGAWDPRSRFGFGGIGLMDSATSPIAAGVSYRYVTDNGAAFRRGNLGALALGVPVSSRLFIGASGKYVGLRGLGEKNGLTADAGLIARFTESFALSLSAHNLVNLRVRDFTPYYAAGLGYATGPFALALDVRADFETEDEARFTYHGGGEYFVTEGVPVRLGYARDELNRTQFWSTGLGLLGTGAGIDLAYRHEMGGRGGRLLSATVRVVVN